MKVPTTEIANIVFHAFQTAFKHKYIGILKDDNSFRSSYFLHLIGIELEKNHFKGAKFNYQRVPSIEKKERTSGEWLFDLCITTEKEIIDNRYKDGKAMINTNTLFACESEFSTGLKDFTTDFGKLLCSNANQYLFVQGLNQSTQQGRIDFIDTRKKIITSQLEHLILDDFVLAFIPTPYKMGNSSFWDQHEDAIHWASIWIYSASQNKFEEWLP